MANRRAWLLNFDGEEELESLGTPFAPSARAKAWAEKLLPALAPLVGEDLIFGTHEIVRPEEVIGFAWLPTPRALRLLHSVGVIVPRAPDAAILRLANDRAFCSSVGQTLPGAEFVTCAEDALAVLRGKSASGGWVGKRAFGFAGRGHRRFFGSLSVADRQWLERSFAWGAGLQVEPWVTRSLDVGLHGYIGRAGDITIGSPTAQLCDRTGTWRETRLLASGDLSEVESRALHQGLEEAASALKAIGYYGPFGIDGFRYELAGQVRFNPRCEINARYSMGWGTGMGAQRADLAPDHASIATEGF